jgi:hypothetical protein
MFMTRRRSSSRQEGRLTLTDEVAGVDQIAADASVDRGLDAHIGQVQLGTIDLRLCLLLGGQSGALLGSPFDHLHLGDGAFLLKPFRALEFGGGLRQLRFGDLQVGERGL